MDEYESLSHSRWECKYHVVFIPKFRRKKLYTELRQHLGEVFKRLSSLKLIDAAMLMQVRQEWMGRPSSRSRSTE